MAASAADPSGAEFPRLQLAHRLHPGIDGDPPHDTYALFPILIPRPAHDRVTACLRCAQCQAPIECTVYSARSTAWRRRRYLFYCFLLAAGALGYCLYGALYFSRPGNDPAEGWKVVVIPFFAILVLPALAIMARGLFALYRADDGVRIKPVKEHSLREPGQEDGEDVE